LFFAVIAVIFVSAAVYAATSPLGALRALVVSYLVIPTSVGFRVPTGLPLPILTIPRAVFAGFLLGFAVNRLFAPIPRRDLPRGALYLALYVLFVLLESPFGLSPDYNLKVLFSERLVGGLIILLVSYSIVRGAGDFVFLLRGLYVGAILVALVAFWEAATGTRFNNLPFIQSASELDVGTFAQAAGGQGFSNRGGILRVESTYEHSIFLGLALTMLLPFLLTIRARARSGLERLAIPLLILGAVLTVSRTAWFSIVIASFLAGKRSRALFVLSVLTLVLIGLPFLTRSFEETAYVGDTRVSSAARWDLLTAAARNMEGRQLLLGFGVGAPQFLANNYGTAQSFLLSSASLQRVPSDNSLALTLLSVGVIGTALFLLALLTIVYPLVIRTRGAPEDVDTLLVRATVYCVAIQVAVFSISNSVFQHPRLSVVFFGLLGSGLGVAQLNAQAAGTAKLPQRSPAPLEPQGERA
jgi:hypothetical protein